MFRNLFNNIPPVTKNILILNLLFFLATVVFAGQRIDLHHELGLYYPSSNYFEPYQIATHFFMHADLFHLLFNMIGLLVMGSHLERYWGAKRYLIFYFITALGAALLYTSIHGYEVYAATGELFPNFVVDVVPSDVEGMVRIIPDPLTAEYVEISAVYGIPCLGASGAIYGLILAFAMLFPNTEFMLIFPPIPIKAKWLAIGLGVVALYQGIQSNPGDSVAHFAHLGGMLFGFLLIKLWQKDRGNFY